MILYADKPDWSKAFTGATHLIQLIDTLNYVFAFHYYGDFFSGTKRITSFNNFDVIEERPVPPISLEISQFQKIEAEGIRKAVAHLKENHGGDRFSSSAYLTYADDLENTRESGIDLSCSDEVEEDNDDHMREDCPIIETQCKFYSYQYDRNGEVAISYCHHPNNPSMCEGNCTHSLCPLTVGE